MAYTTPITFVALQTLTAAQLNGIQANISSGWPYTTAGDIAYATSATAKTRLGIGATGQALVVIGAVPTWKDIYPVGSVYISTVATNPATLFGFGTWAAFGAGRTIIGVGTSDAVYAAGATGGESNHILTQAETPAHVHTYHEMSNPTEHAASGTSFWTTHFDDPLIISNTGSIGGGAAHNNLPPYVVAYLWQRVS